MKFFVNTLIFFMLFGIVELKANTQNTGIVKVFDDWAIIKNSSMCFTFNYPYQTREFEGFRNKPYALIKYVGNDRYSINIRPGFKVHEDKNAILIIDTKRHLMKNLDNYDVITFSNTQDIEIINSLLTEVDYFKVETFSSTNRHAIDFYSVKGLVDALHYMNKVCSQEEID